MLPPIIRRISFILIITLSLAFSAYQTWGLYRSWNPLAAEKNEVSVWENRLQPIKAKLPTDVTQVGYLAEWDVPGLDYGHTDQFHEFNLTVYTLAPLIVRRGTESAWVVGNFGQLSAKKFEPWLQTVVGNHTLQEISGGIYLIHRVEK